MTGAQAAVDILRSERLTKAPEQDREALRATLNEARGRTAGGVTQAVSPGAVDAVIAPEHTRQRISTALAAASQLRGRHSSIPF